MVGAWSCQTQNTETEVEPRVKVTRIHLSCTQRCTDQPGAGEAVTRLAESFLTAKVTVPPSVTRDCVSPRDVDRDGEGVFPVLRDGPAAGPFVPGGVPGSLERSSGLRAPALDGGEAVGVRGSGVVDSGGFGGGAGEEAPALISRACGGSSTAPFMTLRMPHQETATAAPMANSHTDLRSNPVSIPAA